MPKVGFTGRNYVTKFIKAKLLERRHKKVVTECLTCSNHINLSFSRYNNNRGKFCSKKCDFNYKPTRELLNLFCKEKFKLSIEQLQKEVLNKKLTATKVGIDTIGNYLTEINVTSPTGLKQINELNDVNLEKVYWDKLEIKFF